MPEGAEVKLISEFLNDVCRGKTLSHIEIQPNSKFAKGLKGWSTLKPLLPLEIVSVWTRGKLIVFELAGDKFLVNHLLMTGKWLTYQSDYTRLWLEVGDGSKYYFDDVRAFGKFEICLNREELRQRLKSQGPDLMLASLLAHDLNPILSPEQEPANLKTWLAVFQNKRIANKPVMDLLKDNARISGIGNYLRAEILYRARISPHRTLRSLSKGDIEILYQITLDTMYESYLLSGYTLKDYELPTGKIGQFIPKIYSQAWDEFGNKIEQLKIKGKQTMYWVPAIQI